MNVFRKKRKTKHKIKLFSDLILWPTGLIFEDRLHCICTFIVIRNKLSLIDNCWWYIYYIYLHCCLLWLNQNILSGILSSVLQ